MKKILLIFMIFIFSNIQFNKVSHSEKLELKGQETFLFKIWSLKTSKANLRTGPGKKYPIKWIYIKKNGLLKL